MSSNGIEHPYFRRAALPKSHFRNPLLLSMISFGMALALMIAPVLFDTAASSASTLIAHAVAVAAAAAGVLVLLRSAAIKRIDHLQRRSKLLLDDFTRLTLYSDQVTTTLESVAEFRRTAHGDDPLPLIQRVMENAASIAAASLDSPIRLYLVETTLHLHVVRATAGNHRFGIEAGKSCPADRPLEEVLPDLGRYWHVAPLMIRGAEHKLVLLAERPPTHPDCMFLQQTALALTLAGRTTSPGRHGSLGTLRAV